MLSTRDLFVKLPAIAMLALAAACGGADEAETAATTDEAAPAVVAEPAAPAAGEGAAAATPTGEVVEVRMVTTMNGASGVFEPQNITVKPGTTIRWVMADGQAAHNVSFTQAQGNPAGWTPPADSPYLTQAGQSFDLVVDWPAGIYNYVCVPHAATGMVGTVTVEG